MLIKRIISAIILIPLVVIAVFFSSTKVFCVLSSLITLGIALEWSQVFKFSNIRKLFFIIILIMVQSFLVAGLYSGSDSIFQILNYKYIQILYGFFIIDIVFMLGLFILVVMYNYNSNQNIFNILKNCRMIQCFLGALLIIPFWLGLNFIKAYDTLQYPYGSLYLLLGLVVIWLIDSAAYFTGKAFGKNKLIVNVSPGKTWEGVIGSLLLLLFFANSIVIYTGLFDIIKVNVICLVVFIFAVFGDLFESMLKRVMQVKDSGNIIPGHGGILDRLDSIITAIPVYWILLAIFFN